MADESRTDADLGAGEVASGAPALATSRYDVLEKLGEGGMGVLYRARDRRLDRTVALKLLRAEALGDEGQRRRFVQEARAASALNHPNVVTVYEVEREPGPDGADFIVMEFIQGRPLSQVMGGRRLEVPEALALAQPVAAALAAAHAAGIVHRDVKPGNVMVSESGQIKVLDFGLAKLRTPAGDGTASATVTTGPHTTTGLILGTPAYMSPEQAQGQPVDERTDVFSLGAMLYEMLAGRRPFQGDGAVALLAAILRDEPPPLTSWRPDVPRELAALVHRCLAKDRDQRPRARVVADELAGLQRRLAEPDRSLAALLRKKAVALPLAFLVVGAVLAAGLAWRRAARERWARDVALPELERLAADVEGAPRAFALAEQLRPIVGNDPRFQELERQVAYPLSLESDPPGVEVAWKDYLAPEGPWRVAGVTPLRNVPVPSAQLRWRFRKDGYEEALGVFAALKPPPVWLAPAGSAPAGMVRVAAGAAPGVRIKPVTVGPFWIDRFEVTNAEYKKFVDAGGYRRPELWKHPFVLEGRTLSFEQAQARLVDATGRPGPATWELGSYPAEQGGLPVGGLSWYEAAAFAEFSGKSLPTVHHWSRAAGFDIFSDILRFSNFGGKGPQAVGSNPGMSTFGTLDMAGNVREWCVNAVGTGDLRYILGGAWSDPTYMFTSAEALPAFDRHATNGVRLARYEGPPSEDAAGPITFRLRDYTQERPVGDDVFRVYEGLYAYDPAELAPEVVEVDDASEHWRREKVTVAGAYGERLPLYLFLPKTGSPPFQVVEYFPPGSALLLPSSDRIGSREFGFLVRSGRAVVFPVYKSTYERRLPPGPRGPNSVRDVVVQEVKDARRALDYVATRRDLDAGRVGYYGLSLGAQVGVLVAALEPRLKAVVLTSGGLSTSRNLPEADALNFAPRIQAPTLMINGRHDFLNPVDLAQVPLFRLLGTPPADKRHVLFEGGHVPPRQQELVKETLDWLDRYLGPVAGGR